MLMMRVMHIHTLATRSHSFPPGQQRSLHLHVPRPTSLYPRHLGIHSPPPTDHWNSVTLGVVCFFLIVKMMLAIKMKWQRQEITHNQTTLTNKTQFFSPVTVYPFPLYVTFWLHWIELHILLCILSFHLTTKVFLFTWILIFI